MAMESSGPFTRKTFEKSTTSYVGLAGPWPPEKYSYIIAYKHVHVMTGDPLDPILVRPTRMKNNLSFASFSDQLPKMFP